jgi:hypothetical protein
MRMIPKPEWEWRIQRSRRVNFGIDISVLLFSARRSSTTRALSSRYRGRAFRRPRRERLRTSRPLPRSCAARAGSRGPSGRSARKGRSSGSMSKNRSAFAWTSQRRRSSPVKEERTTCGKRRKKRATGGRIKRDRGNRGGCTDTRKKTRTHSRWEARSRQSARCAAAEIVEMAETRGIDGGRSHRGGRRRAHTKRGRGRRGRTPGQDRRRRVTVGR